MAVIIHGKRRHIRDALECFTGEKEEQSEYTCLCRPVRTGDIGSTQTIDETGRLWKATCAVK